MIGAWRRGRLRFPLSVWLAGLLVFALAFFSIRDDSTSDPQLTLLVAQAIVQQGTTRLDAYQGQVVLGRPFADLAASPKVVQQGGHFYHYFPLGPSLLSAPFVAAANALGYDMQQGRANYRLQNVLSAVTCLLAFWGFYGLAASGKWERKWDRNGVFPKNAVSGVAVAIALVSTLGSTVISSGGTALWSANLVVVLNTAVLWLLLDRRPTTDDQILAAVGRQRSAVLGPWSSGAARPVLVGVLLFLTFICRASSAVFVALVLAYLLFYGGPRTKDQRPNIGPLSLVFGRWSSFLLAGGVALALLLAYLGWNFVETGGWLPPYYGVARLAVERPPLWVAVYGHLLSPSRGLLVYSPFLLVVAAGVVSRIIRDLQLVVAAGVVSRIIRDLRLVVAAGVVSRIIRDLQLVTLSPCHGRGDEASPRPYATLSPRREGLFWWVVAWLGLHLWLVSRAATWWGGHSFGPRLWTEVWPGLVLLTLFIFQPSAVSSHFTFHVSRFHPPFFVYLLLGIVAIFIHSGQGLFNLHTGRWNVVARPVPLDPAEPLGYLFDWRYPQFLASSEMLCRINEEEMSFILAHDVTLGPVGMGQPIGYDGDGRINAASAARRKLEALAAAETLRNAVSSLPMTFEHYLPAVFTSHNDALFVGWSPVAAGQPYRWSECEVAKIVFELAEVPAGAMVELVFVGGAHGTQAVTVALNGRPVGDFALDGRIEPPQVVVLPLAAEWLRPGARNEIVFMIPGARPPSLHEQRRLGLALQAVEIRMAR